MIESFISISYKLKRQLNYSRPSREVIFKVFVSFFFGYKKKAGASIRDGASRIITRNSQVKIIDKSQI
jgi:hypothetical protein